MKESSLNEIKYDIPTFNNQNSKKTITWKITKKVLKIGLITQDCHILVCANVFVLMIAQSNLWMIFFSISKIKIKN